MKKIILILFAVLVLSTGGFFLWASDYYHAEESAKAVVQNDTSVSVQGGLTILSPETASDTAFIFYPGAKVEASAYLPILQDIKDTCGITCILVEMPLNMAIFDSGAAGRIIERFPEIKKWYVGGHSMGGAMASSFASGHTGDVEGLILMGAYIYGDYPPEKALTVYGTFNSDLEKNIDYTENIVVIDGGNHAQFGNYGKQKGDPDASISDAEQQKITVDAIQAFLSASPD